MTRLSAILQQQQQQQIRVVSGVQLQLSAAIRSCLQLSTVGDARSHRSSLDALHVDSPWWGPLVPQPRFHNGWAPAEGRGSPLDLLQQADDDCPLERTQWLLFQLLKLLNQVLYLHTPS
jgi:hypothetical protein